MNLLSLACIAFKLHLLPLGNDEFLAGAMRCDSNIDNYFSPYLMRFNSMGDTLWSKQLTPSNIIADNVYPRDIKKTSDGGYLMTGHADHNIGPNAIPYGWIVKMDSLGNTCWELGCDSTVIISNIEEIKVVEGLQLSPNPTKSHLQIQIPTHFTSKPLQLQLTNIEGRVVLKEWVEDGTQVDIADLAAGIYIATWLQDGQALKREKVVVLE
ncbi:MAG: T9SS type A sorting domain-containing protein [Chitinophagales bacterium]